MPAQVFVDCPAEQWTLVASAAKGGLIHRYLTTPDKYAWAYSLPGGDPPTDESDGVAIFDEGKPLVLPLSSGIDVYIYPYAKAGSVRADILIAEVDVNIQDQTTPPIEYFLTRTLNTVVILNSQASKDNTLVLAPGHLTEVGDFIEIYYSDNIQGPRYSQLLVVSLVGDTIRVGQFIGYELDPLNIVESIRTSGRMNVLGTIDNPVAFHITPPNGSSGVEWDLTRLIIGMVLDGAPDDSKFGDITGGVLNGIFFGVESIETDYFLVNIRTNAGFRGSAYDVNYVTRSSPQGAYGMSVRKSFAGQDKYGVAIRLTGAASERFVIYIQDDLTNFVEFGVKVMGHIVD